MKDENLERMIRLAEEFFETKNDPAQISVDEDTIKILRRIHRTTMAEIRNEKGPVAWVLVIPTTTHLMDQFIAGEIHERELLLRTPLHVQYDALYLCSALVLPEFRRQGLAKRLVLKAIRSIRRKHPIQHLFYWEFSIEGRNLASTIANEAHLPLVARTS
jgi:GNAT superfamily N-acetyltransferase